MVFGESKLSRLNRLGCILVTLANSRLSVSVTLSCFHVVVAYPVLPVKKRQEGFCMENLKSKHRTFFSRRGLRIRQSRAPRTFRLKNLPTNGKLVISTRTFLESISGRGRSIWSRLARQITVPLPSLRFAHRRVGRNKVIMPSVRKLPATMYIIDPRCPLYKSGM